MLRKSMEWFLYDNDLRHKRVKNVFTESVISHFLKFLYNHQIC